MKANKRGIVTVSVVILLLLIAASCRYHSNLGIIDDVLGAVIRRSIHNFLLIVWVISLQRRIIKKRVRAYLMAVAVLTLFWLLVRSFKYDLPYEMQTLTRYLWYSFYIPMLFIPLMGFFYSLNLGTAEDFVPPKSIRLLYIPTFVLLALVFTNDLHELVFVNPIDQYNYTYGIGYIFVSGWIVILLVSFLVTLFKKSRLPGRGKRLFWPIVPILATVVYAASYIFCFDVIKPYLGDLTAMSCVLIACTVEACIYSGLIPSNTRYRELIRTSTIAAEITDDTLAVRYSTRSLQPVAESILHQAVKVPVVLSNSMRLLSSPISGGHVFWQEDVSELLGIVEELRGTQEELKSYSSLLIEENKQKRRRKKLEEQKLLYDAVQKKTATHLKKLGQFSEDLRSASDESYAKVILGRIAVLGAFVKRRSNLVFLTSKMNVIPGAELELCLKESLANLRLCGVIGAVQFEAVGALDAQIAGELYDFFEYAVELSLDTLKSITVILSAVNMTVLLQSDTDMTALGFFCENDVWYCTKPIGGVV